MQKLGLERHRSRLERDVFKMGGHPLQTVVISYLNGQAERSDVVRQLSIRGYSDQTITDALG